jgi:hypothetical protein
MSCEGVRAAVELSELPAAAELAEREIDPGDEEDAGRPVALRVTRGRLTT